MQVSCKFVIPLFLADSKRHWSMEEGLRALLACIRHNSHACTRGLCALAKKKNRKWKQQQAHACKTINMFVRRPVLCTIILKYSLSDNPVRMKLPMLPDQMTRIISSGLRSSTAEGLN
jgi:hypothetical protein